MIPAADREKIGRAFSRAPDYENHARIQRIVAQKLALRIAALPLPAAPRILEIGCGTGFLTEALFAAGLAGEWLITDVSPQMVERCRRALGPAPDRRFAVLDGEFGTPGGRFDLICSSLAMQWFGDQEAAVRRMLGWLAPGGHCLFTTLGDGTFAEWRDAHEIAGVRPGTRAFLPLSRLQAILPERQAAPHEAENLIDRHDGALGFLRSLRMIGAQTARRNHAPLSPRALRQVMQAFDRKGAAATYQVVTCHYRAPAP